MSTVPLTDERMTELHEEMFKKHMMHPFWIFTDIKQNKKFWCFLGGDPPGGVHEADEVEYECAMEDLSKGHWKAFHLKHRGEGWKAGYGFADSPSKAFIDACFMAGYLKRKT